MKNEELLMKIISNNMLADKLKKWINCYDALETNWSLYEYLSSNCPTEMDNVVFKDISFVARPQCVAGNGNILSIPTRLE